VSDYERAQKKLETTIERDREMEKKMKTEIRQTKEYYELAVPKKAELKDLQKLENKHAVLKSKIRKNVIRFKEQKRINRLIPSGKWRTRDDRRRESRLIREKEKKEMAIKERRRKQRAARKKKKEEEEEEEEEQKRRQVKRRQQQSRPRPPIPRERLEKKGYLTPRERLMMNLPNLQQQQQQLDVPPTKKRRISPEDMNPPPRPPKKKRRKKRMSKLDRVLAESIRRRKAPKPLKLVESSSSDSDVRELSDGEIAEMRYMHSIKEEQMKREYNQRKRRKERLKGLRVESSQHEDEDDKISRARIRLNEIKRSRGYDFKRDPRTQEEFTDSPRIIHKNHVMNMQSLLGLYNESNRSSWLKCPFCTEPFFYRGYSTPKAKRDIHYVFPSEIERLEKIIREKKGVIKL
jgi:hypothetical protein